MQDVVMRMGIEFSQEVLIKYRNQLDPFIDTKKYIEAKEVILMSSCTPPHVMPLKVLRVEHCLNILQKAHGLSLNDTKYFALLSILFEI